MILLRNERDLDLYLDNKYKFYGSPNNCPILLDNEANPITVSVDSRKIYTNKKVEINKRFYDMVNNIKYVFAKRNIYVKIINYVDRRELSSEEEFNKIRNSMGGITDYSNEDYKTSNNLHFSGIENYIPMIDESIKKNNDARNKILNVIFNIFGKYGITCTFGKNSGGDIEITEVGSTGRGTNIPGNQGNWDIDFTLKINPKYTETYRKILKSELKYNGTLKGAKNKVRLTGVNIPGMENVDLDFALIPNTEKYVSCDDAVSQQLENIKKQDVNKYREVIANIIFAKKFMKSIDAYKILRGSRKSGIGGIGIETWIMNNGGSFIDAVIDFLKCADQCKDFYEFKRKYTILSPGENHNYRGNGRFGHSNFINVMGPEAYYAMIKAFRKFLRDVYQERNSMDSMFTDDDDLTNEIETYKSL